MKSNLYIVGTNHGDLYGKKRLTTALNKLSPSILAIEWDLPREKFLPQIYKIIKDKFDSLKENDFGLSNSQAKTLNFYMDYLLNNHNYEVTTAKEWAKNQGTKLEYIDLEGIVNEDNLDVLSKLQAEQLNEITNVLTSFDYKKRRNFLRLLDKCEEVIPYLQKGIDTVYRFGFWLQQIHSRYVKVLGYQENYERLKQFMDSDRETFTILNLIHNPKRDEFMVQRIRELHNQNETLVAVVGDMHCGELKKRLHDLKPKVSSLLKYK